MNRHCHILDRPQIEGLIHEHFEVVDEILREALTHEQGVAVRSYFEERVRPASSIDVAAPDRVLAGLPFGVRIAVRSSIASAPDARVWWRPGGSGDADAPPVRLIGPVGAGRCAGVALASDNATEDPIPAHRSIELVTYSVTGYGA